jgi:hypothetical protein
MTLYNFGLSREILRQIYEEEFNDDGYDADLIIMLFGRRADLLLEPFQEDRYLPSKSDAFPQGARAKEFGRLSLSAIRRKKLLKTIPSKPLQAKITKLWPATYCILKDVSAPIYYKYEKDPAECEAENQYLFSIFLKQKKDQEPIKFPEVSDIISLFKIDDPLAPKPLKFQVESIDHFVFSTALIVLRKIN